MKNLITLYVLITILTTGCAKFDYLQGSGLVTAFQIQNFSTTPPYFPGDIINVTGVCDPEGGLVELNGSALNAPTSGTCDPALGEFSIDIEIVASGENLEITGQQLDGSGNPQLSLVGSINVHCAALPMASCALNGSGNASDPYIVDNILCLQEMREGLSCSYALNNDIDASAISSLPGGWEPVPNSSVLTDRFTGQLDGRGHSISNLYMTPRAAGGSGLFSRIFDEGNGVADDQVFDLTLVNPTADNSNFGGNSPFGLVAGSAELVGLRNISVINGNLEVSVSGARGRHALLVGEAVDSVITNSSTSGTVVLDGNLDEVNTKFESMAGFVGSLVRSQVINSETDSSIISPNDNLQYYTGIGGAFGSIFDSSVSQFRVTTNLQLRHIGVNAFGSGGMGAIGGFAGTISESANLQDICVDHNINLSTGVSNIGPSAGYIGRSWFINSPITSRRISVRGSLIADANGNNLDSVGGYFGNNSGVTEHRDIFMDSDITIVSGVSPFSYVGYGGLAASTSTDATFENIVGISSHSITTDQNDRGGLFHGIFGVPLLPTTEPRRRCRQSVDFCRSRPTRVIPKGGDACVVLIGVFCLGLQNGHEVFLKTHFHVFA